MHAGYGAFQHAISVGHPGHRARSGMAKGHFGVAPGSARRSMQQVSKTGALPLMGGHSACASDLEEIALPPIFIGSQQQDAKATRAGIPAERWSERAALLACFLRSRAHGAVPSTVCSLGASHRHFRSKSGDLLACCAPTQTLFFVLGSDRCGAAVQLPQRNAHTCCKVQEARWPMT